MKSFLSQHLKFCMVFLSCFALAFVAGSLTFIPYDSSAESTDADVNLTIDPVIALALSPQPSILLDLTPTPLGHEVRREITATVSTNNITGYTLTMSTTSNTTALTHTNTVNTVPSTTNSPAAALPNNTWGYNKGSGVTTFLAIPPLSTPVILTTNSIPVNGDTTTVTVGAKADLNILAGTYANTLVFTAIANDVPPFPVVIGVPTYPAAYGGTITVIGTNFYGGGVASAVTGVTVGGTPCIGFGVVSDTQLACVLPNLAHGTYPVVVTTTIGISNANKTTTTQSIQPMQGLSAATCATMPRFPAIGSEIDMQDARDNNIYKIRKLADNNCWMVDNLSLQPTGTSIILDSTTSDIASGTYTLNAANVHNPNGGGTGQAYCTNLNTTTYPHRCGRQYVWIDATLGETSNSVCPKNWRLPINNEYTTLRTAEGMSSPIGVRDSAWRGLPAGHEGAVSQGAIAYFWTSSFNLAFGYNLTSNVIYSSLIIVSYDPDLPLTTSVRCLAR